MQPRRPTTALRARAIIVMGVSGSGKSMLGRCLAEKLDSTFIEGDDLHTADAVAKMRASHPLDDADRWPWLDRVGAAVGAAVAREGMAVAACSALKRRYRERLAMAAGIPLLFVLLDAHRDLLSRRLADRPHHFMPTTLLDSQLATLERPDADEPVIVLDAARPPLALCEEALVRVLQTAEVRTHGAP
jgi:gluconokinase